MSTYTYPADPNSEEFISAPTDRRPDFVAEALSPAFRVGLLAVVLTINLALLAAVVAVSVAPGGIFAFGDFAAVMYSGSLLAMAFFAFLVFGAFLGNNAQVTTGERWMWYALFVLAGPLSLPVYWYIHVWPAKFEPLHHQTT